MSLSKKILVLIGDVAVLHAALLAMLFLRYRFLFQEKMAQHLLPFYLVWAIWLLVFYLADLYRINALKTKEQIIKNLSAAIILNVFLSIALFYLFGNFFKLTPKTNLLLFSLIFFVFESGWRFVVLKILSTEKIKVIFYGDSPMIRSAISHLKNNPQSGYEVVAHEENYNLFQPKKMGDEVKRARAELLVAQGEFLKNDEFLKSVHGLFAEGVRFKDFLSFYEEIFEKAPIGEIDDAWVVKNIRAENLYYDKSKRLIEFVFAFILIILLFPIMTVIGLLVFVSSPGPLIYKQERVGRFGRIFTLYKFRTMYNEGGGPLWTEKNDKRVTFIGSLLRVTHLDEILQLFNVLRGDVSFIGPRPERTELAKEYEKIRYYNLRHAVKPGITGWAQINFRPSTSIKEAEEKLCYDVYYIKNRSLILDLFILVKTIKYVFVQPK